MLLGGVHHRGGGYLECFIPGHAPEAALAARGLDAFALFRVVHDRFPGVDGITVDRLGLSVEIDERAASVRILHTDRAIEIPGEADTALTTARLVRRETVLELRVVGGLQFPRNDPVFDEDLPTARSGAVDTMSRSNPLVVLEAVAIELLPLPLSGSLFVPDPFGRHRWLLNWRANPIRRLRGANNIKANKATAPSAPPNINTSTRAPWACTFEMEAK